MEVNQQQMFYNIEFSVATSNQIEAATLQAPGFVLGRDCGLTGGCPKCSPLPPYNEKERDISIFIIDRKKENEGNFNIQITGR